MAITVDWSVTPWLITVPKSDLTLDTGTKYNLTVDTFWQLLRDFSDSAEAIPRPTLYSRIPATASTPSITEIDLDYYEIQFEDGLYSVNIIDGNTNIRDGEVKNQVSVNTNNTTGFIDQSILVFGTFNSGIYWDAVSGKSSITNSDTDGNEANPLLNLADVQTQAVDKKFTKIHVVADAVVGATDDLGSYRMSGKNSSLTKMTFVSGSSTSESQFEDLHLEGDLSGALFIDRCHLTNLTGIGCTTAESIIKNTILDEGTLQVRSDNNQKIHFLNCSSSGGAVILDINNSAGSIHIHHYLGMLQLANMTVTNTVTFDSPGGELTINASNTAGTVSVRGTTVPIDNSGAGCTVNDNTTPKEVWTVANGAFVRKILQNKRVTDPVTGITTIYDDDNSTIIYQGNIWENVGGTTPYSGGVINRQDRLVAP